MTKKIISEDDSDLFRQAVGKVRAITTDTIHVPSGNRPKPRPKHRVNHHEHDWLQPSDEVIADVGQEESLGYAAPGIQKAVLAKLRKGFFAVQAELDLHGLNGEAAKRRLQEFLLTGSRTGRRCVLIIHGKGYRSNENIPVLKNHLNRWLRQHALVQAFCSAPNRHGGAGAVFVLLKLTGE